MKSLHNITIATIEAWVWTQLRGGNGKQLTPFNHLHLIQRGTPPPRPEPPENNWQFVAARDRRRYWTPWQDRFYVRTPVELLTPLCGRVRSQSRAPTAHTVVNRWNPRTCPNCEEQAQLLGITPAWRDVLVHNDPWSQLGANDRLGIDPISGQ